MGRTRKAVLYEKSRIACGNHQPNLPLCRRGKVTFNEETEPEDDAYIVEDLVQYTAEWTGPDDAVIVDYSWTIDGDGRAFGSTDAEIVLIGVKSDKRGMKSVTATCDTTWEIENPETGEPEEVAGEPAASGSFDVMINETWIITSGDLCIIQDAGSASISIEADTTAGDIEWEFINFPATVFGTGNGKQCTVKIRPGQGIVEPPVELLLIKARSSEIERSVDSAWVTALFFIRSGTMSEVGDPISQDGPGAQSRTYIMKYSPNDRYDGFYTFTAQGEGTSFSEASVEPLKSTVSSDSSAAAAAAVTIKLDDSDDTSEAFAAGILTDSTGTSASVDLTLKHVKADLSFSKTVSAAQEDKDQDEGSISDRLHENGQHQPNRSLEVSSEMRVDVSTKTTGNVDDWSISASGSGSVGYEMEEQVIVPAY